MFNSWVARYKFTMPWKAWSIGKMETVDGRNKLREIFERQDNEP